MSLGSSDHRRQELLVEKSSGNDLLDSVLNASQHVESNESTRLIDAFLAERDPAQAIRIWLSGCTQVREAWTRDRIIGILGRDLARLDTLLTEQVNAILHQPKFQQLEASWRSLWYLTGQAQEAQEIASLHGDDTKVQVRIFNLSKRELFRDFERAAEFDQSTLFKKVYEDEFGRAGGEPIGALVGDYQFTNHIEDVELLSKVSEVAAAAFCPFISAASPQLVGLDDFSMLSQPIDLTATMNQLPYLKWRSLRDSEDSRFLGLTLPRVLMRAPYDERRAHYDGFRFREDVEGPNREKYLWGNAAFPFAAVLMRAFAESGWFAEIRGVERGIVGGGLVTGLATDSFRTDRHGVIPKSSTEVAIDHDRERELSSLGLIPLCHCEDTDMSVFYTNQSLQKPKAYTELAATVNAKISAMLQYMMCASRFAHYLKVLARNKLGSVQSTMELENYLGNWLHAYVSPDEHAPPDVKAQYPLREGEVRVVELPGKPGSYALTMHLLPHFQLDELTASLKLVTRLQSSTAG